MPVRNCESQEILGYAEPLQSTADTSDRSGKRGADDDERAPKKRKLTFNVVRTEAISEAQIMTVKMVNNKGNSEISVRAGPGSYIVNKSDSEITLKRTAVLMGFGKVIYKKVEENQRLTEKNLKYCSLDNKQGCRNMR